VLPLNQDPSQKLGLACSADIVNHRKSGKLASCEMFVIVRCSCDVEKVH